MPLGIFLNGAGDGGFSDGRSETSPDSEQIEPTETEGFIGETL